MRKVVNEKERMKENKIRWKQKKHTNFRRKKE